MRAVSNIELAVNDYCKLLLELTDKLLDKWRDTLSMEERYTLLLHIVDADIVHAVGVLASLPEVEVDGLLEVPSLSKSSVYQTTQLKELLVKLVKEMK